MNTTVRKYFAIGALAIALFIIILIIALVNQKPLDITGRYSLKVDGKYVNTTLVITSHGDEFVFTLENPDGLRAIYTSKKMLSGNYTLADISGRIKHPSTGSKPLPMGSRARWISSRSEGEYSI